MIKAIKITIPDIFYIYFATFLYKGSGDNADVDSVTPNDDQKPA